MTEELIMREQHSQSLERQLEEMRTIVLSTLKTDIHTHTTRTQTNNLSKPHTLPTLTIIQTHTHTSHIQYH